MDEDDILDNDVLDNDSNEISFTNDNNASTSAISKVNAYLS